MMTCAYISDILSLVTAIIGSLVGTIAGGYIVLWYADRKNNLPLDVSVSSLDLNDKIVSIVLQIYNPNQEVKSITHLSLLAEFEGKYAGIVNFYSDDGTTLFRAASYESKKVVFEHLSAKYFDDAAKYELTLFYAVNFGFKIHIRLYSPLPESKKFSSF